MASRRLRVLTVTASTNGATVTLSGGGVTYTPQPDFIGVDRFSYTVSDGRGGTATADVVIYVADGNLPSQNQVSIEVLPGGVRLRFAGIPGRAYDIQRSSTLPATWTTITTVTAPEHGILEYLDTASPPGMGFYRTTSP